MSNPVNIRAEAEKVSRGTYEHYADCTAAIIALVNRAVEEQREVDATQCDEIVRWDITRAKRLGAAACARRIRSRKGSKQR